MQLSVDYYVPDPSNCNNNISIFFFRYLFILASNIISQFNTIVDSKQLHMLGIC